jgi:amidase
VDATLSLSAIRQAALIRSRKISSVELVRAHLDRIAAVNPAINAVVEVMSSRALAAAEAADAALARGECSGAFHGVPFSVKDAIETAGTRCTAGTLGRADAPPSILDAVLVTRLQDAGAILIAKTNLPDLLFAFESDNLLFGRTNNPYDLSRTAGGSSGGEAALIAACGSPMGLGSDCAGSVRLPAAFCGIAAIKPASGRLDRAGHFPAAGGWIEALWQIGPMARHVEDLEAMMQAMAGSEKPFSTFDRNKVRNLRIAFYTDNGFAAPDPEVARVVRSAAKALSAEENRPSCLAQAYELEMKLIGPDGGDSLRAFVAHLGSRRVHPLLTGWLDKLEAYRTGLAGFQNYWAEWDAYRAGIAAFLSDYDAIVCPVYTRPAIGHGTSTQDDNFRGFSHTMAYNLAGLPAATVRCGESVEGLPIGVQVVARPWREDVALAVAGCLEEAMGGWKAPGL